MHLFIKLPEAKEKHEYMLMLSESSEESATFFIITSMLLSSEKDFTLSIFKAVSKDFVTDTTIRSQLRKEILVPIIA